MNNYATCVSSDYVEAIKEIALSIKVPVAIKHIGNSKVQIFTKSVSDSRKLLEIINREAHGN